jgi:hypothetical protein
VKRFLVLLVLIAGGIAAASFAVPTNAAVVDGQAITQNQLDADVTAIANSSDYGCYLSAQQALETGEAASLEVDGVEQPGSVATSTSTAAFVANYLDTAIGHQLILHLAGQHHVRVTSQGLQSARTAFATEITSVISQYFQDGGHCGTASQPPTGKDVLATMPAAFVQENAQFDASVAALEEDESGTSTADQLAYYDSHRSMFENACFTVAPYTSASAAESARGLVYEGEPFAKLASQVTGGGPQACEDLYSWVSALPPTSGLQKLPLNTVSAPIAYQGQYLLLELTKSSPLAFSAAQADVVQALEALGASRTENALNKLERHATVVVDPRYGVWKRDGAQVLVPAQPSPSDVLRAGVNSPSTTTTTTPASPAGTPSSTPSTTSGSSSSGQSG